MIIRYKGADGKQRLQAIGYEGPKWVAIFWLTGWFHFSLGFHIDFAAPNIEIHLPGGFLRLGRQAPPTRPLIFVWRK